MAFRKTALEAIGGFDPRFRTAGDDVDECWRLQERELSHLHDLQCRLLRVAAERLKPGGKLVYSTCSIEPEENQEIVRSVLNGLSEFELESEAASIPGLPADGGYWARLRRKNTGERGA